jgi:hypothetical protein
MKTLAAAVVVAVEAVASSNNAIDDFSWIPNSRSSLFESRARLEKAIRRFETFVANKSFP